MVLDRVAELVVEARAVVREHAAESKNSATRVEPEIFAGVGTMISSWFATNMLPP
jgi:hypothetical protein